VPFLEPEVVRQGMLQCLSDVRTRLDQASMGHIDSASVGFTPDGHIEYQLMRDEYVRQNAQLFGMDAENNACVALVMALGGHIWLWRSLTPEDSTRCFLSLKSLEDWMLVQWPHVQTRERIDGFGRLVRDLPVVGMKESSSEISSPFCRWISARQKFQDESLTAGTFSLLFCPKRIVRLTYLDLTQRI